MNRLFLVIFAALLTISCNGNEKTAGGSPGETTNGIQAFVVDKNGVPSPSARVYLYDMTTTKKIDSTETDSSGNFEFEKEPPAHFGLELITADSGQMAWFPAMSSSNINYYYALRQACVLTFLADSLKSTKSMIQVIGTPYAVHGATAGRYSLRVPQGSYAVTVDGKYAGFAYANQPYGDSLGVSEPISGVVLEDFDDGDRNTLFAPYWPEGTANWWLGLNDVVNCIDPFNTLGLPNAMVEEGAWKGKSLRIKYQIIQWVGHKFGKTMDLSGIDSISIMAKGQGKIRISLEHIRDASNPADKGLGTQGDVFIKTVWTQSLGPDWKRLTFYPTDTLTSSLSNAEWEDINDRIDLITVFFQEGFEAWIDELTIYGIPTSAWALQE